MSLVPQDLRSSLAAFQGKEVCVVGDVLLDHYIWGDVSRISPEAPVPLVNVERETWVGGGAANVALNLQALGIQTRLLGGVGQDADGDRLRDLLESKGISTEAMQAIEGRSTIVKTRIMARHQQLCRLDREEAPSQYLLDPSRFQSAVTSALQSADVLLLSDYGKGALEGEFLAMVLASAKAANVPVLVDPKPRRPRNWGEVYLMTPNRAEALEMAGVVWDGHEEFPAETVCRGIWERYHPQHLVVTLGSAGMLYAEGGEERIRIPTVAREVFDVSGAGDTVIATLAAGVAAGMRMIDAVALANLSAGVAVMKLGTATVSPEEILAYAARHSGL